MHAYKNIICNNCDCLPVTEKKANGIFSLPLYPKLKVSKVLKISKILRKILLKI